MSDTLHRSPAFQFYADDFLAGTLDLSQEEVGAYVRLLCHQWNRGSIPVEPEKQQRLAGGSVSVDVLAKFRLQPDGRLVNERLEMERAKQAAFREKQRLKGLASAESRRNQPQGNRGSTVVQPSPQPNTQPEGNSPVSNLQTSSIPSNEGSERKRFAPPSREELDLAAAKLGLPSAEVDKFVAYFGSNGWMVGRNKMKSWQHALTNWKLRVEERNGQRRFAIGTSTPDDAAF